MRSETEGPAYPIESVRNALLLLLLLRERKQLQVSECAAHLGVARSTAHRLLAMLEHYGFLRRDAASRTYRPGGVLLSLVEPGSGLAFKQSLLPMSAAAQALRTEP